MGDLTKHFSRSEFECHGTDCCGHALYVSRDSIDALEALRERIGKPIVVNCAYRCPKHNKAVGGVSTSQHIKGTAFDIVIRGMTPAEVAAEAKHIPAFKNGGIGVYRTFTHLDTRGFKARWSGK